MIDLGVFAEMFAQFDQKGAAQLTEALEDAVPYSSTQATERYLRPCGIGALQAPRRRGQVSARV
jgi:hypothetical protein